MRSKPILVIGATGYVGGRLIPALLEAGYRVRAMGRTAAKVACRSWPVAIRWKWSRGMKIKETGQPVVKKSSLALKINGADLYVSTAPAKLSLDRSVGPVTQYFECGSSQAKKLDQYPGVREQN